MFSKFNDLHTEKQERILNAAAKEFAHNGFADASTNTIVKDADISKGLLFHYFKNKKQLFLFLYDYYITIFTNEFFEKIDLTERDILKRLKQTVILKFELIKKHPEMFNFLMAAYMENSPEVKPELESKNKDFTASNYQRLLEDIDTTKFRKSVDLQKAINIIMWTLEGFATQEQTKAKIITEAATITFDYDRILSEIDAYMELFQNCFYD